MNVELILETRGHGVARGISHVGRNILFVLISFLDDDLRDGRVGLCGKTGPYL